MEKLECQILHVTKHFLSKIRFDRNFREFFVEFSTILSIFYRIFGISQNSGFPKTRAFSELEFSRMFQVDRTRPEPDRDNLNLTSTGARSSRTRIPLINYIRKKGA